MAVIGLVLLGFVLVVLILFVGITLATGRFWADRGHAWAMPAAKVIVAVGLLIFVVWGLIIDQSIPRAFDQLILDTPLIGPDY